MDLFGLLLFVYAGDPPPPSNVRRVSFGEIPKLTIPPKIESEEPSPPLPSKGKESVPSFKQQNQQPRPKGASPTTKHPKNNT